MLRNLKFNTRPTTLSFGVLVVGVIFLGCDDKSKTADRTGTRNEAVDANQKSASTDEDEFDETHEHPIFEKSLKTKPKQAPQPIQPAETTKSPPPEAMEPAPKSAPAPSPAPAPTPAPTPPATPPPPAPGPGAEEARLKAMYDAKKMVTTVMIDATGPDPASDVVKWFSSPAKPITCYAAVDAAGALVVPAGVNLKQIASGSAAAPENTPFKANNADVATLHSSCQVCNKTGMPLYLHSGNTGPFSHGAAAFATGTCVQFLVERLTATAGANYDHAMGAAATPVSFKIVKIGPDGKVVP